jgi:hypothetical protein
MTVAAATAARCCASHLHAGTSGCTARYYKFPVAFSFRIPVPVGDAQSVVSVEVRLAHLCEGHQMNGTLRDQLDRGE